jgi:hypothetical protein
MNMPRGIAKSGMRMTSKRLATAMQHQEVVAQQPLVAAQIETDAEIAARLNDNFDAMHTMALATFMGKNKSLIISGPAGVGKSHTVTQIMEKMEGDKLCTFVKGYVRPTGLYKMLYENRHKDCVIVFDDSDSVFMDDVCLNLLKAACDMTRTRRLSWLTETKMEDEDGERLPRTFEFEGSIIFITNYDFDNLIDKGNRLAPHFQALISRSHYLDVGMKTKRDYVVRLKQVVAAGMLRDEGFNQAQENELMSFITESQDRLRELSLRMVIKLANLMSMGGDWKKMARATCMK